MSTSDTYKTITKPSEETLFKEKKSKFFSYAIPVQSEDDVKLALETLRNQHSSAGHCCYAYQLGTHPDKIRYRANDDGEPNNSAGMPIYGQIQSYDVTNILIAVVRYFGGVKLGVGGLISAYRTGAQMALDASHIKTKTINVSYLITFDYKNMNKVMRIIKEKNLKIVDQTLELDCKITISVRQKEASKVEASFNSIYEVSIKELED
ncbi:MAG: YigZ family protein [Bizionia sp.]|nr:YigZ family protein [Bizionia sp.]